MLMIESLSRGAIADAIYTLEQIDKIGSRALALNEAIDRGLLTESRQRLLMEDLDKAMNDLKTQSQSSLGKLDKAVAFIENFLTIGSNGKGVAIWDLIGRSFGVAKEKVSELTTIDLGTIGNMKAFFNEGGKLAAIMDALSAEMNLMAVYIKILSGAFSQTIRQMKALPANLKEKGDKDLTLRAYLDSDENRFSEEEKGKTISSGDFEDGLLDVMQDIQAKNGGYTWSIKGIKNWFGDNKKGMGIAALAGGIGAIAGLATGGLALGPLAALAAKGAAVGGGMFGLG
ncbi:MAG TPA: hypothetical protein DD671_09185, partial [Balneolaceae bacterium]|nr:hypothetical protein [Balneolaceae bacterium]